jgi:hypothetical protein
MKLAPTLIQAQRDARAAHDKCHTSRNVWLTHSATLPPLRATREADAQALANNDTAQALALAAGDAEAARHADAQAAPLIAALAASTTALERAERIGVALLGYLRDAEAALTTEVSVLRVEVQQHAQAVHLALAEEFRALALPLIQGLPRLAGLASALGLHGTVATLRDTLIPDLASPGAPWVRDGRVKQAADSSTVEMTTAERDAAHAAAVTAPRRALAELESYRPFDPKAPVLTAPTAPTAPQDAPSTPKVAPVARGQQRSRAPSLSARLA